MKKLALFILGIALSVGVIAQSNRVILRGYFETGDVPTQAQFTEFINSVFNLVDDYSLNITWTGTHSFTAAVDFASDVTLSGDILMDGLNPQIYVSSATGESLYIIGGDHLAGGVAGNVYIYGGSSLGGDADVWLGYSDAGITERGSVHAKTQSSSDNSTKLATTAYADAAGSGAVGDNINFDHTTDLNIKGIIYKGTDLWLHDYEETGSWGDNTFLGSGAGNLTMGINTLSHEGSANTGIGTEALHANRHGWANTAVGRHSLRVNIDGFENTAFGRGSLINNTIGNGNTALGKDALYQNISGDTVIGIGHNAFYSSTTGSANLGIGEDVGYTLNSSYNTMIGYRAGRFTTSGGSNVYYGYNAGYSNVTGSHNLMLGNGTNAPTNSTSNYLNIGNAIKWKRMDLAPFLHDYSSSAASSVGQNTFIGTYAGNETMVATASYESSKNVAIGWLALNDVSTGFANVALGHGTLDKLTTGYANMAIGMDAMGALIGGWNNIAIGRSSMLVATSSNENVAIGKNSALALTIGNGNTLIGHESGNNITSGNYNILIGRAVTASAATVNSEVNIANLYKGSMVSGSEYAEIPYILKTGAVIESGGNIEFTNASTGTVARIEADAGSDAKNLTLQSGWTSEATYDGGNINIDAGDGKGANGDVFISGGWDLTPANLGRVYLGTDIAGSYSQDVFAKTQSSSDNSNKLATTAYADAAGGGMVNPMTTTGDIIYSSSGSTPARLGVGTNGYVLTLAAGLPSWAAATGGATYWTRTGTTLTTTTAGDDLDIGSTVAAVGFAADIDSVAYAASTTLDWDSGANLNIVLGGNLTLTFDNIPDGGTGTIILTQDGTGGRTLSVVGQAGYSLFKWRGGVSALSTGIDDVDVLTYVRIGGYMFMSLGKDYY